MSGVKVSQLWSYAMSKRDKYVVCGTLRHLNTQTAAHHILIKTRYKMLAQKTEVYTALSADQKRLEA